jgi:hypothetical protein
MRADTSVSNPTRHDFVRSPEHWDYRWRRPNGRNPDDYQVSYHGRVRMGGRRVSIDAIVAALMHGRVVFVRGACIHAIGRKEIKRFARWHIDLANYDGVQVVCSHDGTVISVYRNRDFRGLRPRYRRRNHRQSRSRRCWVWVAKAFASHESQTLPGY